MSSARVNIPGFEESRFGINPGNHKPFIEFSMDDTSENRDYLTKGGRIYEGIDQLGGQFFVALGTVNNEEGTIRVHIEGKTPVYLAIAYFKKEKKYEHFSLNTQISLCEFQNRVKEMIDQKTYQPPVIHKNRNNYHAINSNPITKVNKKTKTEADYLYKRFGNVDRSFLKRVEIESAAAAFYRLIMGNTAVPKTFGLYNTDEQMMSGVLSELFDDFQSAHVFFKNLNPSQNEDDEKALFQFLLDHHIVPMLVASYYLAENDLHDENWGFVQDPTTVRVDFGRSIWPVSCKYSGRFPNELQLFKRADLKHLQVKPNEAFNITSEELKSFPNLSSSIPVNWFTGERYKKFLIDLSKINQTKSFEEQKWKYFLKCALISPLTIRSIFRAYLSGVKTKKKLIDFLTDRNESLKSVLLDTKEFRDYVSNNLGVVDELVAEFEVYNKEVKDKYACLRVNISEVQLKLSEILDEIGVRSKIEL